MKQDNIINAPASGPYLCANIRLDDGFYAVKTDLELPYAFGTRSWDASLFAYFDGISWQPVSSLEEFYRYYSVTYYADDQSAFDDTGIWGLGGYSVVSNAIPEPSMVAGFLGMAALAVAARRRR